tara:strand:- start:5907 stop:6092 length:186 start_codon:yes stop_codon:yes gene_type:complete
LNNEIPLQYFNAASNYIIENWKIGINEKIPDYIITKLENQNFTLIHNLEIEIGKKRTISIL